MTNFVSTHWGTYETSKNNQNNIKINKWSKDPNPSDFGLGFLDAATSDLRINQPHIRKEWLNDRHNKKNLRGLDEFVPVSWEEAIDLTASELQNVKKQVITYKRADGLELSGILYLPVNYDEEKKEKMPMILWAYPREYKDRNSASQNNKNPNRFTSPYYGSMVYWVTKGYVVLDDASSKTT